VAIAAALLALGLCAPLGGCSGARADASISDARSKFEIGNGAYERGAWLEAVAAYRDALRSGADAAALQYNLGNALFKAGRLGESILAYERALKLDPVDADARSNLEYCRTLITDRIPPAVSPLSALGITYLMDLTTRDQDAMIVALAWIVSGIGIAAVLASGSEWARRAGRYAAFAGLAVVLLAGANLALKSWTEATHVYGVVLQPEVNVLSGAGDENPTLFTIHEGLKVRVRSRQTQWVQVSLDNGLTGWLPAASLEVL
jgi:tetratricopeptide (TPR) repeat protein